MALTLGYHLVKNVQWGEKTELKDGVLWINDGELRSYLLADKNFSDVVIDIAHPGEMTRIINVLDIVDPRKKASEGSEVFPGWIGKLGSAGWGRTKVLRGVSIIETGHMEGFFGGIIDMGGTGSQYSPYSRTHNIILAPMPAEGVNPIHYSKSLKMASLKTSVYLGNTALNLVSDEETAVGPASGWGGNARSRLPRVGYIWQVLSQYKLREIYYYGATSNNFFPIFISPSEIFDGAVVSGNSNHSPALKNYTYSILNHPVIMELCSRHGREIDFVGTLLTNEPMTVGEKKWVASMNAQIAKTILQLDGVILTKEGGGHTDFDLMETCKECEKMRVKTTMMDIEMLDSKGEGEYPLVVFEPEADAIVSLGNVEERVDISKMEKVIGGENMKELGEEPKNENNVPIWLLAGAISEIGMSKIKGREF